MNYWQFKKFFFLTVKKCAFLLSSPSVTELQVRSTWTGHLSAQRKPEELRPSLFSSEVNDVFLHQ